MVTYNRSVQPLDYQREARNKFNKREPEMLVANDFYLNLPFFHTSFYSNIND